MILFNAVVISQLLLGITCLDTEEFKIKNYTSESSSLLNSTNSNEELKSSTSTDQLLPASEESDASSITSKPSNDLFDNLVQNEALSNSVGNDSETYNSTTVTTPDYLSGKHDTLINCSLIGLEPGEYELLPDGSLYIEVYNITYNESLFYVFDGVAHFCDPKLYELIPTEMQHHLYHTVDITKVGLAISMICLFLHLIVFVVVPDLRNLPGWNLAALCLSLLISYFLLVINYTVQDIPDLCFAIALLTHFFFMSSFLWMTIMSFDVFVSLLRVTGSLRVSGTQFKLKKFAIYSTCAFGVAFVFALLGFLADVLEGVPEDFKPNFAETCWFTGKTPLLIFFAAPVIVLTCINLLFFLLSSYKLYANKMKCEGDDHKSVLRQNYLMYLRLAVIMGVTWVVGILAAIAHTDWLWALFVVFNTLQGLYIFLAFTCNKKVVKFFRLKCMGNRRPSEQTLSPTFQSYCFYANSIEKDLDKFVESKTDSKSVIDTVVIHL